MTDGTRSSRAWRRRAEWVGVVGAGTNVGISSSSLWAAAVMMPESRVGGVCVSVSSSLAVYQCGVGGWWCVVWWWVVAPQPQQTTHARRCCCAGRYNSAVVPDEE